MYVCVDTVTTSSISRPLNISYSCVWAGLAHGRVKARNVLLFPGSPRYRAKLADFGLQAALTPRERSVFSGDDSARWTGSPLLS